MKSSFTAGASRNEAGRSFAPGEFDYVISNLMMLSIDRIELLKRIRIEGTNKW